MRRLIPILAALSAAVFPGSAQAQSTSVSSQNLPSWSHNETCPASGMCGQQYGQWWFHVWTCCTGAINIGYHPSVTQHNNLYWNNVTSAGTWSNASEINLAAVSSTDPYVQIQNLTWDISPSAGLQQFTGWQAGDAFYGANVIYDIGTGRVFNGQVDNYSVPAQNNYEQRRVTCHEIGHAIGLHHEHGAFSDGCMVDANINALTDYRPHMGNINNINFLYVGRYGANQ